MGHITRLFHGSDCHFPQKMLISFIIFEILFYVATTTKNIFCVKYGVKLEHLSVAPKFYNNLFPQNVLVSYCLFMKYTL